MAELKLRPTFTAATANDTSTRSSTLPSAGSRSWRATKAWPRFCGRTIAPGASASRSSGRTSCNPILLEAERQLREYFAGSRTRFELPLDPSGTDFQRQVWRELLKIPFGETRSYVEIARRIGSPRAARAVGAANGRNPISIVAPCHRVVGANGALTGFAGGLDAKARLLALERAGRPIPA